MPDVVVVPGITTRRQILIVDDHPVLRRGVAALIESEPELAVCGEAATVAEALEAIMQRPPDLVIVDLGLGPSDGLELIKAMKSGHPAIPTLVLSMYDEFTYAERCLRAGASGYVSKEQLDGTLLEAMKCVLRGETYMSRRLETRLAQKQVGRQAGETAPPLDVLSDRELQVFRLIGRGRTTRQIAESLNLSIKTIESHREHIKGKLALESTAQLAQHATRWVEANRGS